MRNLVVIEAPSNLGLKEPIPGVEPGVKFFASATAKENFAAIAGIKTTIHVEARKYDGIRDEETGVYTKRLANELANIFREVNKQ